MPAAFGFECESCARRREPFRRMHRTLLRRASPRRWSAVSSPVPHRSDGERGFSQIRAFPIRPVDAHLCRRRLLSPPPN